MNSLPISDHYGWPEMVILSALWSIFLERYGYAPAYWADDVRRYIDALKDNVVGGINSFPCDIEQMCAREGAGKLFLGYLQQFGELMIWWPLIFKTVKKLRATGIDLACCI
jgi:hypothetical protein